jgi:hypothetical protein
MRAHAIGGPLFVVVALLAAETASAQVGGALRRAAERAAERVDVSKLMSGDPPITTSLPNAVWAAPDMDTFEPPVPVRPLAELERSRAGAFVLRPGYWEMRVQSYCLKAGTHGPGGGDGYLYAPTRGPAEDAVLDIARNSVAHPEISQQEIQVLLWAIIARTKFEQLPAPMKATAARLLDARQLALLNRSALDVLPGPALDRALGELPPLVRQVLQAEARLRQMLVDPASSFQQLEGVAVLAGMVGLGPDSRAVPAGRWSLHPDGYYVRYLPEGYSQTLVQLWVPESVTAGAEFDGAAHIAVPGNTARQRLLMSGRAWGGR